MAHDQCPSTVADGPKHKPGRELRASAGRLAAPAVNGQRAFRSAEDLADTPEFRDFVEREFPAGASELLTSSRRTFLQLMGASVALAGAATLPGCRRPDHTIMSYGRVVPEEVIPGKALYYATSMPIPGGGAEGLIVETHEGRPTKIEGNPFHPTNRGATSIWAQAAILELYDPDRLKYPIYRGSGGDKEATWDDFAAWSRGHMAKYDAAGGQGLAFVTGRTFSPSNAAAKASILKRWPKARFVAYEATQRAAASSRARVSFKDAAVVVSIDCDFLHDGPAALVHAREFAATRRVMTTGDAMSRLYSVESAFSATGSQADHRLRLSPSQIGRFAFDLARFVIPKAAASGSQVLSDALAASAAQGEMPEQYTQFVRAVGMDLLDSSVRGRTIVLAGEHLPAAVQEIARALNAALGSTLVSYEALSEDEASDGVAGILELASAMKAGEVSTLVCVGANPCYDAPAECDFAALFAKVPATVCLSVGASETAAAAAWSLNGAHFLESWGDTRAHDGTIAPIQPMIAPLYGPTPEAGKPSGLGPMSPIEFLALLAGSPVTDGHELVRSAWRERVPAGGDFEKLWRRALHDGVLSVPAAGAAAASVSYEAIARSVSEFRAPSFEPGTLEVVFATGRVLDGRYANNPWLQELPDTGTMVVWDNPALMSPRTAQALGLWDKERQPYSDDKYPRAHMALIELGGRSIKVAAWILPGMADNTVVLKLGYGRKVCGVVGDGVGFDVSPLRTASSWWHAGGAKVAKTSGDYWIASTQNHWTMEGRTSILRSVDLAAWKKHGDAKVEHADALYGTSTGALNFAERLGELSHTPPNLSIYDNPFNASKGDAAPQSVYAKGPQWGMTIDLSTCTGCGTCTIACQAENNIPVVGKKEVAKGREMAWIRVDRYFTAPTDDGDAAQILNEPGQMMHQPVACVHCENAPCETVCPVNATVHGPEGINYMVYNRCIGTRYCANNCPYKVRRFNFFDYGVTKFNGGYVGREAMEKIAPAIPLADKTGVAGSTVHNTINPNLIPPRLREKLDEISRMQKNPDVTVRSRGVMEKCTYCIQRINAARIEWNLRDGLKPELKNKVPDGFFQAACQQACPSGSIVFGDILDETSRVSATRRSARSYALLGYLNTRPRTSHMVRVNNPNPMLRAVVEDPFHGHGGHGAGDGHGDGDGHGHDHHDHHDRHDDHKGHKGHDEHAPAEGGHSMFVDPRRRREDSGYAMSLRVLGSVLTGGRA